MKRIVLALVMLFGVSAFVSAAPLDRFRSRSATTVRQTRTLLPRVRTAQTTTRQTTSRITTRQPIRSTWTRTLAAVRRVTPFGG